METDCKGRPVLPSFTIPLRLPFKENGAAMLISIEENAIANSNSIRFFFIKFLNLIGFEKISYNRNTDA